MNKWGTMRWITAVTLWLSLIFLPDLVAGDIVWRNLLARTAVIGATLLLVYAVESRQRSNTYFVALLAVLTAVTAVYILFDFWLAAWPMVILWFASLLLFSRQLSLAVFRRWYWRWLWRLGIWGGTAVIAGMGLALANTILSHFAEEEFFVAISGLYLSLFWLLLALSCHLICAASHPIIKNIKEPIWVVPTVVAGLALAALILIPWTLRQYQRSFFPLTAPTYEGISDTNPFICEQINAPPDPISGAQIKDDLIRALEAAPNKDVLTWGSLALYDDDPAAAVQFRTLLMEEAAQNKYTSPAHSIKWGQYEAALRARQLVLVNTAFPDLFSDADWQLLDQWFAAINRRAMTTEWVDWLYAAAYGKQPEGPYENQEIGGGLLAALTNYDLADDSLAAQNADFLRTTPLGWRDIFRNTDDSYSYQAVWLANAWQINQYRQQQGEDNSAAQQNIKLSLLWMLLMSLPDGESLYYNINGQPSMAPAYLFGASLLNDPELSWLTGKTLQRLLANDRYLFGSFAVDSLELADGQKPTAGSCLLFGNSGVPTEKGPLAPDKVVLRDGWFDDAAYVLLNLRFTGWHRYKATNTLPLIYQNGPLVSEQWTAERFSWLPSGRGAFRDKRAPREFLNGLLLPVSGLPEVLWRLTAVGSPWAQDPPAYTNIDTFFTSSVLDMSTTTIPDWRGWQHERTVYLIHNGLALVVDNAKSSQASRPASLIWHLNGSGQTLANGLRLDNENRAASIIWPKSDNDFIDLQPLPPSNAYLHAPDWELMYTSPSTNELKTAFAFPTQGFVQGNFDLTYVGDREGVLADWSLAEKQIILLHNFSDTYLEAGNLGTDGTMLSLARDESSVQVCYTGGQTVRIRLSASEKPAALIREDGSQLAASFWQVNDEWLIITLPAGSESDCLVVAR